VNPERRLVRATLEFFQDLDRQLGAERGLNGQPSTNDFHVLDLLRIIERFATEFESLPELISGRSDYRVLVGTGFVVAGYLVVGQLASDGAVELVQLELDVELGWD
jgi:hypothetical protein